MDDMDEKDDKDEKNDKDETKVSSYSSFSSFFLLIFYQSISYIFRCRHRRRPILTLIFFRLEKS